VSPYIHGGPKIGTGFFIAFKILDISQGSVATHRCGGIFIDSIITSFLLILKVKEFENRLIFDEVKAYEKNCAIFWATRYIISIRRLTMTRRSPMKKVPMFA